MPRYRITIEYDGTSFLGWQRQADGASVQGALEEAVRRFTGETVTVHGAGRTDSGVHALGQVAHFDLPKEWEPFRVREAINYHLRPATVAVLECARAPDDFDARRSAVARHYRYRILSRRAPPTLERDHVWWLPIELDADAMHAAAQVLIGHHDFTTFRASQCQAKSPVKTLDRLQVSRYGEEIVIDVSARSFLHNQVRSMVGSLRLVGEGKWNARDLKAALDACDRAACGPVAAARGLYLTRVDYPSWL
ncbi:tRNA pseudouridine(38-40) synthase TruA [Hyphomicrobium sulfonivorans]|uniref:tRNA pseudouridine(38-40) synthase TruA n=1 Tax=Hyphomicrobium sulfonivorans TaxID=121290 RepID=UPI00156E649A|nr:tRNA pseudouridine(38-40) synthase TruA [Hyphomicrobium sulfonivorans]MBI1651125.1 tRNA pseudouridine(38-40) synthase TruA [Hyphomicrobium sulfonivorans]NSL72491.1 tRNA pseudouridine(38-40) synthase TruA [Hyphomicrobium sulfonivorans]